MVDVLDRRLTLDLRDGDRVGVVDVDELSERAEVVPAVRRVRRNTTLAERRILDRLDEELDVAAGLDPRQHDADGALIEDAADQLLLGACHPHQGRYAGEPRHADDLRRCLQRERPVLHVEHEEVEADLLEDLRDRARAYLLNHGADQGLAALQALAQIAALNRTLSLSLELGAGEVGQDRARRVVAGRAADVAAGMRAGAAQIEPGHDVAVAAVRRALRAEPPESRDKPSQKAVVLAHLGAAIAKASGDGAYRFSPRQVFYVTRPLVREAVGAELQWGNFETIIGDYELEQGEVAGMYRDPRGTLYHPHLKDSIPLGTLQVERYERPEWTFNKILFIEKEGFFEALKEAAWPERHDCALLTSKGQPTRAARDLLDLLGETGEEILFFAVHDADAAGTLIYQSLQEATRARPGRRVRVINLGLEPEEAVAMGLELEDVEAGERRKPIASYAPADWQSWLLHHRVELNAMTTPQFVAWLDDKMAAFGNGKLVPPAAVLTTDLSGVLERGLRRRITEQILASARIDDRVAAALREIALPPSEGLRAAVHDALTNQPADSWRAVVAQIAEQLLASPGRPTERGT